MDQFTPSFQKPLWELVHRSAAKQGTVRNKTRHLTDASNRWSLAPLAFMTSANIIKHFRKCEGSSKLENFPTLYIWRIIAY